MALGSLLKSGPLRFQQSKLALTIDKNVILVIKSDAFENKLLKRKLNMFRIINIKSISLDAQTKGTLLYIYMYVAAKLKFSAKL